MSPLRNYCTPNYIADLFPTIRTENKSRMKLDTLIDFEDEQTVFSQESKNDIVIFSGNLDLSVLSMPPILAPKYSLIAVINHYGTSSGGHCKLLHSLVPLYLAYIYIIIHSDVAYCKHVNGWYFFDDSTVSSITETEIVV